MINKTIHYVWLGKKEMPESFYLSRDSITKYAGTFEVKIWTEKEVPEFNLPAYYYKLMNEKRFALASDIYRMHILNKYGGVYFDTDQILIATIDDLLNNEMFISKYHEVNNYYGFGLLGAVAKHEFLNKMINFYDNIEDDKYIIINKIGSDIINHMLQFNKIKILDQDFFYPLSKKDYTKNTRSYHVANTSWIPLYKKILHKVPFYTEIKIILKKILPNCVKKKIFKIEYL